MGLRSYDQSAKEMYRVTFNVVSGVVGEYASERITFGARAAGDNVQYFREVSALIEGAILAGAVLELWLPKVAAGGQLPESFTDADYFNSNVTALSTAALGRWQLSGWPGAQLRLKGGTGVGAQAVSASAF